MKKILLDTHIIIWLANDSYIGGHARNLIQDADSVYVSSVSILELRVKQAAGKLPNPDVLIKNLDAMDLTILEFTKEHANAYRQFNIDNKDPFDNALIGIAIFEKLPFVTVDMKILPLKYDGLVTVNARK